MTDNARDKRETARGRLTHLGLRPFATSLGAAGFAERTSQGPVTVLLESLKKTNGKYQIWLHQATLSADSDGVHFDVIPIRQLTGLPSNHASHAELRRAMKAGSHA